MGAVVDEHQVHPAAGIAGSRQLEGLQELTMAAECSGVPVTPPVDVERRRAMADAVEASRPRVRRTWADVPGASPSGRPGVR